MKRIILALPLLLALTACHITINNDDGTTREVDVESIAFKVFQQIPQDAYDAHYRDHEITCPDSCTTHFELRIDYSDFDETGYETLEVDCLPMDGGGWLAFLTKYGCVDACCYDRGKAYVYKDGELTEVSEILPTPPYEGEILDDSYYSRYIGGGKLFVDVVGLQADESGGVLVSQESTYSWDGKRFVELSTEKFTYDDEMGEEDPGALDMIPCDMEALYQALCAYDERFRDFEPTVEYGENELHGTTFSTMDAYSASLNVSCKPLSDGSFKVLAVINSMEDGEEDSFTTTYNYKDSVLTELQDE